MFSYTPIKEKVIAEQNERKQLEEILEKCTADIDYIAMMSSVDLDTDTEAYADE